MKYQPEFIGKRPILNNVDKTFLAELANRYTLKHFHQDIRNYDELAIDFVYTSAKIEGNTYDRLETDNLLRLGITAGGKRHSDALMLINLRNGFNHVMQTESNTVLDLDYLGDLHTILMKDLLPPYEQGIVRTSPVNITATRYKPPSDPKQLRTEVRFILDQASEYTNPFEQAIYLHCNLAYLQYFRDGNKRTARLMQTAALVRGQVLPLFFDQSLIEKYLRATVNYYETGDYDPYIEFFKENYSLTILSLTGEMQIEESHKQTMWERIEVLQNWQAQSPAEKLFQKLAQEAIARASSPLSVNWPDVERLAIYDGIRTGISSDEIINILCKYSPGTITQNKQTDLYEDAQRITANLKKGPSPSN